MRCNERTNACLRNTKESPRVGNWYFVRRDIPCLVLGRLESVHDPRRGGKRRAFVARYIHFNAPRPWTGAAPGPRQVPPIRQMTRDCPPRLCGAQGSVLIRTAAEKELAGPLEGPGRHGSTSPRHDPRLDPFFVTLPLSCLPAQPRFCFRHALHQRPPSRLPCCELPTPLLRAADPRRLFHSCTGSPTTRCVRIPRAVRLPRFRRSFNSLQPFNYLLPVSIHRRARFLPTTRRALVRSTEIRLRLLPLLLFERLLLLRDRSAVARRAKSENQQRTSLTSSALFSSQ